MVAKMYLQISGLLLLLAFPSLLTEHQEPVNCKSQTITCVCGIGETKKYVPLELKMYAVESLATGKLKCDGPDPYQACANISCLLSSIASSSPFEGKGILWYFYPEELIIPAGGFPEGHRYARQAGPCHIPVLKNAAIKCWKWPNWMNCDVNCIHGYAFQDSKATLTTKNINCRNSENVWKPHEFKDCQPFLNCNAQLVKPGSLKCHEPIDSPAYCEISCLDYGEQEATGLQKYECIDESFGRTLPHCAVLKKDVSLLPKPK